MRLLYKLEYNKICVNNIYNKGYLKRRIINVSILMVIKRFAYTILGTYVR